MNRREALQLLAWGALVAGAHPQRAVAAEAITTRLAGLERASAGRLGVAILDTGSGLRWAHRGDERFLMCSTFKLLLVAAILRKADANVLRLDQRVVFEKSALLDWAPVTRQHVGAPGLTLSALCEAAITQSDNTAANLLLATLGGPAKVTALARDLGDSMTRLDRTEPTLNRSDGAKDTTSPAAMLDDMDALLLGHALSAASRARLIDWLLRCQTGSTSLRAGLPRDWREGDKTGSGDTATNDIAIVWPPGRAPLLVTAYVDNAHVSAEARYAALAAVGRIVATV